MQGVAEETVIMLRTVMDQAIRDLQKAQQALGGVEKAGKGAVAAGDKAAKETEKTAKGLSRMSSNLAIVATQIAASMAVIKTLVEGINFNAFIESNEVAFGVMLDNVELARDKLIELRNFSLQNPLTLRDVIQGAKQMRAYGMSIETVTDDMEMLGDVALALNIPMQDMVYIYGTLRNQAQAYARDLMQFGMRGIPIYEALATVLEVSVQDIRAMTQEGRIGFAEVERAFQYMTQEGGQFAGMMERSMETFTGMSSVLKDLVDIARGELTEGAFEELKDMLPTISGLVRENMDSFREMGEILGTFASFFINAFTGFVTLLIELPDSIKKLIMVLVGAGGLVAALQLVFRTINFIAGTALTVFSPTGAIIAGIGVIVTSVMALVGHLRTAQRELEELERAQRQNQVSIMANAIEEGRPVPGLSDRVRDVAINTGTTEDAAALAQTLTAISIVLYDVRDAYAALEAGTGQPFDPLIIQGGILQTLLTDILNTTSQTSDLHRIQDELEGLAERYQETFGDPVVTELFSSFSASYMDALQRVQTATNEMSRAIAARSSRDVLLEMDNAISRALTTAMHARNRFQLFADAMGGSQEAAEALTFALENMYIAANPPTGGEDPIRWWHWFSEITGVALEDMMDADKVRFLGANAANAFLEPIMQSVQGAHVLDTLFGDTEHSQDAIEQAMEDIDALVQTLLDTANQVESGIPLADFFTAQDESIKTLMDTWHMFASMLEETPSNEAIKTWRDYFDDWMGYVQGVFYDLKTLQGPYSGLMLDELFATYDFKNRTSQVQTIEEQEAFIRAVNAMFGSVTPEIDIDTGESRDLVQTYLDALVIVEQAIHDRYDLERELREREEAAQAHSAYAQWASAMDQSLQLQRENETNFQERIRLIEIQAGFQEEVAKAEIEAARLTLSAFELRAAEQEYLNQLALIELNTRRAINDEWYNQAQIRQSGDPEYWRNLAIQSEQNMQARNIGQAMGQTALGGLQGTDTGTIMAGGDPLTMFIMALVEAAKEFENVSKALNFIATAATSLMRILGPFMDTVLDPLVDLFTTLVEVVGGVIMMAIAPLLPVLNILMFLLELVGEAFKWLYYKVIAPFVNFFIEIYNKMAIAFNKAFKTNMKLMDLLPVLTEDIEEMKETLSRFNDAVGTTLDYLQRKAKELYESEVQSVQDLYEVGAITADEYSAAVSQLYDQYKTILTDPLLLQGAEQLTTLQEILGGIKALTAVEAQLAGMEGISPDQIADLLNNSGWLGLVAQAHESGDPIGNKPLPQLPQLAYEYGDPIGNKPLLQLPQLASGTGRVPQDMVAQLHAGESVVPNSFMDAIRNGDLALVGGTGSSGGDTIIINVAGSIIQERDLERTITGAVARAKQRGTIAVGA